MNIAKGIRSIVRDLSLISGVYERTLFSAYRYMYSPQQLMFIVECLKSVSDVHGCVVEVGVSEGHTTVFINRFMDFEDIERDYFAVDTFSGFNEDHSDYEIKVRGKSSSIKEEFRENKKSWFDRTMAIDGVRRVKSIESDVTKFDFSTISPIAFCLLDVDLYVPIRHALPRIYGEMSQGGIILVDDCRGDYVWDGALQAYKEFVAENGLPVEIAKEKLGVIRR